MSQPTSSSSGPRPEMERQPLPSDKNAVEQPCPECGEMVRTGLVRCWNCGAFQKKEMAERYAQMQANPAPVVFSEVPEGEALPMGDVDDDAGYQLKIVEARSTSDDALADAEDEAQPAAPPAKAEAGEARSEAAGEDEVAHSVATGGDVLLQVALTEQAELRKRRKERGVSLRGGARTPGGFVIYCPYGCRMEVKDQHRGMSGRCPKCRAPFIVPIDPPDYDYRERESAAAAEKSAESPTGAWTPWLVDLHLHQVQPEKLKLKAASLQKDFVEVDAGFSSEGLLLLNLAGNKKGGLFGSGGNDKKKPETRQAVQQHLKEGKPAKDAPASNVHLYSIDSLAQVRVAQPAQNPAESMFAGIPVFGEKQVAVQLPMVEGHPPQFLSFGLTGFREFAQALSRITGGPELMAPGVPHTDEFTEYTCHYSDTPIKALQNVEWYQADPKAEVVLAGWKCAACGLAVSEAARAKENLGGKGGKAIAKAKCPKCGNKFGDQKLFTLPSQLAEVKISEEAAT